MADSKNTKISYPEGCRELSDDLSKDELLKRLKVFSQFRNVQSSFWRYECTSFLQSLAKAFAEMGQDENNDFKELALHLATRKVFDHLVILQST